MPKLTGSNWVTWSETVELVLEAYECAEFLTTTSDEAKAKRTRAALLLSMEPNIRDGLKMHTTAAAVWSAAKEKYGKPSRLATSQLKAEFYGVFLQEGELVQDYINAKRELANRLKNAGQDVTKDLCDVVLVGIRSQFETIAEFYDQQDANASIDLLKLEGRLLDAQEARQASQERTARSVKRRPSKECSKCGKGGHTSQTCWSDKTCERCKKIGHVGRVCRGERSGVTSQSTAEQANTTYALDAYSRFCSPNSFEVLREQEDVLVDSGATSHMFPTKKGFTSYRRTQGKVELANGESTTISGRGKRQLELAEPIKSMRFIYPLSPRRSSLFTKLPSKLEARFILTKIAVGSRMPVETLLLKESSVTGVTI